MANSDLAAHILSPPLHAHSDLSKRLNLTKEEGEKWIVNLIRDTRTDAKIDFKEVSSVTLANCHT